MIWAGTSCIGVSCQHYDARPKAPHNCSFKRVPQLETFTSLPSTTSTVPSIQAGDAIELHLLRRYRLGTLLEPVLGGAAAVAATSVATPPPLPTLPEAQEV